MGLSEQKMQAELSKTVLPSLVKQISSIVGKDIVIEIDWQSFEFAETMESCLSRVCEEVPEALKQASGEALKANLSKISIRNSRKAGNRPQFNAGELTLFAAWTSEYPTVTQILQSLDKILG